MLLSLLHKGRISQTTYDLMEKRNERLAALFSDLKEMRREEALWGTSDSEESRILELLLIDLKVRHLLGEIGNEEWSQKSQIIDLGLSPFKEPKSSDIESILKPAPPDLTTAETTSDEETETLLIEEPKPDVSKTPADKVKVPKLKKASREKRAKSRAEKRTSEEPPQMINSTNPDGHCMNPWNKECRNTDIKLSIYYNGKLTPICHKCWEEISKKDIEWSGL